MAGHSTDWRGEYTEINVPPFLIAQSKDTFVTIASPELLSSLSDNKLKEKLYNLSLLGRLIYRTGFIGHATYKIGDSNTAKYLSSAAFEKEHARIEVELIQQKIAWAVSDIRIIVLVEGEQRTLKFKEANDESG